MSAQEVTPRTAQAMEEADTNAVGSKLATIALVGIGAALFEVELIPGMLLGVAAALMPDVLPRIGRALRPMVKGTIRAGYAMAERTREVVEEAREEVEDMMAEARAEHEHPAPTAGETRRTGPSGNAPGSPASSANPRSDRSD
jgi:hypothetical protein